MQNNEQWRAELSLLAAIIRKAPLEVSIKWGAEVFTWDGKNVISYGGFKNFFSLWFYNGVFLEDKYNVLVNASQGKTKSLRQWRFTSAKEIDEKKILEYIFEAIEIEKKGLKIEPAKFEPVPSPPILSEALKADKSFRLAYEKLTPGKQKEYILFLQDTKQEATKIKRLQKMIALVLEGKGLNDKYK